MQDHYRPATGYPSSSPHQPNGGQFAPPGAAYPYAAHPQYPPQPPYYNNPNPSANFFTRSFVRAFLATFICLFLLVGVALLIIWLVLNPSLPAFQLDSLTVTNLSAGPQSVTGTWQVGLVASNRDKKMSITYYALRSYLYYKAALLSQAQVRPFKLDKKSQATLNVTFSATNTYVEDRVVNHINEERARGSIAFDVDVAAGIYFSSGGWNWRKRVLKISCENIPVGISSNATSAMLVGGSKKCDVWRS